MFPRLLALGSLNPQELVVLIVALGGLVPVVLYLQETSPWFVIAYGFLVVGAITTNVENLLWHDLFNFIEHAVGNMGAGIAFAIAAYKQRQKFKETAASDATVPEDGS